MNSHSHRSTNATAAKATGDGRTAVPGGSQAKDLEFARRAIERTRRSSKRGNDTQKPKAPTDDRRAQLRGAAPTTSDTQGDIFRGEGIDEKAPVIKSMGNHMLDPIVDGAENEESRERRNAGEYLQGSGEAVAQAHEGTELVGSAAANPTLGEALTGEAGEGSPWFKAAMAPAIIQMLLAGHYADAAKTLAQQFAPSEYLAGLEFAARKIGLDALAKLFGRWATGLMGTALNVLLVELLWAFEGFKQIREAHESGERDARIRMYSSAFAEAFLFGDSARPNVQPVTKEEREAVSLGLRDGSATAASTGEMAPVVGQALLNRYGGPDNVKHAIIDALFVQAGMTGYKLHEGPR